MKDEEDEDQEEGEEEEEDEESYASLFMSFHVNAIEIIFQLNSFMFRI